MATLTVLSAVSTTSAIPQARARGSLTCVAKASLIDGETFTIIDDRTTYVFEFDVAGNGVTAGRTAVNVSTDTTAAEVAARVTSAINGTAIRVRATQDGTTTALVLIRARYWGTGFNNTITETVANAGFVAAGMTGGALPGVALWKDSPDGQGLWRGTDKALLRVTALTNDQQVGGATIRMWGGDEATQDFAPLGVGADATKGTIDANSSMDETDADRIEHAEVVTGLSRFSRIYAQRVTMTQIATLDLVLSAEQGDK